MLEKLPHTSSNHSSNVSDEEVDSSEHRDVDANAASVDTHSDECSITNTVVLNFLRTNGENDVVNDETFNEDEEAAQNNVNSNNGTFSEDEQSAQNDNSGSIDSSESSHITSWKAYISNNNGVIGTQLSLLTCSYITTIVKSLKRCGSKMLLNLYQLLMITLSWNVCVTFPVHQQLVAAVIPVVNFYSIGLSVEDPREELCS